MRLKDSEYAVLFPKKFLIRYAVETEAFSHIWEEKRQKYNIWTQKSPTSSYYLLITHILKRRKSEDKIFSPCIVIFD